MASRFHSLAICVLLFGLSPIDTHSNEPEKKTVAIIGAGVAGLSAAYLLVPEYQVEVLEMSARTGGNHLESKVDRDHKLNLGASYVPNDDSYSKKLFEEFNIPLKEISLDQAWADYDYKQKSRIILEFTPYFLPAYLSIRALSGLYPDLEKQVTLKSVLEKLPEKWRREALFSIAYDPFIQDDLENVLFIPYMNYIFWIFSSGAFAAPWGSLTNDHLHPYLSKYSDFNLTTNVAAIAVTEQVSKPHYKIESYDINGFPIRTIHAESIVYSGYPQEAAKNLKGIISSDLEKALSESFFRKGRSIVVKALPEFKEKLVYFMSRIHNGEEVTALIDTQGTTSFARVFYLESCKKENLLCALGLKEENILHESDEFIHYAPDHCSIYSGLQNVLKKETPLLNDKGIYFSSYAFHPSGFRNADQSIAMSTNTAKKIFDKDNRTYSPQLKRFLSIEDELSMIQKAKRSYLNNHCNY